MDHHVIMKKYRMFLYGMIVAALGISMITKAELGTSPITSPSYVLTFIFPYSLGVFVLAVNSTLFLFECLVLGRSFKKIQLLQLPATLIFSACIDGWMWMLSFWTPVFYVQKVLLLLAGCAALGLGVALEGVPDVLILPGEGLVRAISRRKNWDFGIVKTCFDMSLVLTAVLLSVLCLGHVEGIREGTVAAAFLVGGISKFFIRHITEFDRNHRALFVREEEEILLVPEK